MSTCTDTECTPAALPVCTSCAAMYSSQAHSSQVPEQPGAGRASHSPRNRQRVYKRLYKTTSCTQSCSQGESSQLSQRPSTPASPGSKTAWPTSCNTCSVTKQKAMQPSSSRRVLSSERRTRTHIKRAAAPCAHDAAQRPQRSHAQPSLRELRGVSCWRAAGVQTAQRASSQRGAWRRCTQTRARWRPLGLDV